MSREEVDSLLLEAHALVSLHRAEGFGLPLLEAQTFGLATITTAWSGNMDFTTKETSLLVPCTLTTTHDVGNVYGDVTWAEPDIKSAAASMRKLYDDPGEFARIATAGWQASLARPSINAVCEVARGHMFVQLEDILNSRINSSLTCYSSPRSVTEFLLLPDMFSSKSTWTRPITQRIFRSAPGDRQRVVGASPT